MKMKAIFLTIFTGLLLVGCAGTETAPPQQTLTYPYVALPERQAQILNGMKEIRTGMLPSEVEVIMGTTDLVHDLFNRGMIDPKPIGYTWWYIIQRKTDTGSSAERAEKLVRVSFDFKDKVTRVDFWGIDKPLDDN